MWTVIFSNNLFKVVTKSLCTRIMFYNMNNFSSFEISNIKYEGEIAKILRMHSLQTFKGGIEHVIFIHLLSFGTILCPSGPHGAFEQSWLVTCQLKNFQSSHNCHGAVWIIKCWQGFYLKSERNLPSNMTSGLDCPRSQFDSYLRNWDWCGGYLGDGKI